MSTVYRGPHSMNTGENILEIVQLSVTADGKELLHDVNLTIPEGEVHTIFGHNGSGKTSLMMTIMGFSGYQVTQGEILFKGKAITQLSITERARMGIGIAQQRPPTIPGVTLRKILTYACDRTKTNSETLDSLVKKVRMEPFLDRDIHEGLSGGEIKRAELLQLLVSAPSFAMIDEPDSGVDIEALSVVEELIQSLYSVNGSPPVKRKSGLIVTHSGIILDHFPIDKAHVMHNGTIGCTGNPQVIMETIKKYGYAACIRCMEKGNDDESDQYYGKSKRYLS